MSNTCTITVFGCSTLPLIKGEKIDPYATIVANCGISTFIGKTKCCKKTQAPQWNETFTFDFCLASTIDINIVDKRIMCDKDIGTATIDLLKVKDGNPFPVQIKPSLDETFIATVNVAITFGFPDRDEKLEKEPSTSNDFLIVTTTFDPPFNIPEEMPLPVKLRCLVIDSSDRFCVVDENSYGYFKIMSSGNNRVFTGSGFSQSYLIYISKLKGCKLIFLVESECYDGVVSIDIGTKKRFYDMSSNDYGFNVYRINGEYKSLKSIQMEVGSKQYFSSPIYLQIAGLFNKIKFVEQGTMIESPNQTHDLFESLVAYRLNDNKMPIRRNLIPIFEESKLFNHSIKEQNMINVILPAYPVDFNVTAYAFDSEGVCIFGDETISKKKTNVIYLDKSTFKQPIDRLDYDDAIPNQFNNIHIDLERLSFEGTKIFVAYYIKTGVCLDNDSSFSQQYIYILGKDGTEISFGVFPVTCCKPQNKTRRNIKEFKPCLLFLLHFTNDEWFFTPISETIEDFKKDKFEESVAKYLH